MVAWYDSDVQLGQFDVSAEVLNAAGRRLEDFIGAPGAGLIDDMMGPPPVDGWRLISGDLNAPAEGQPVFAAPWDNPRGNGWMVIQLWQLDDAWRAILIGDDRPVRPSRARRREGLVLAWSTPPMTSVLADTALGEIAVTLRNISPHMWVNRYQDADSASVSVSDAGEHRVVTERHRRGDWSFTAYPVELLPSIEPGAELVLLAHFDAAIARYGVPPGMFTLVAGLHSLDLRTEPRSLVVEPTSSEPA